MDNNSFGIELVGKIGSMALIDREHNDIDYNRFARIGRFLKPGMVWVSSGATEIGRLDHLRRNGVELVGDNEFIKTDYAALGQAILMETYRRFSSSNYGLAQVLVEHQHFNDPQKREHIKNLLLRAAKQNAIPIINYNDCVSYEENRKMEIKSLHATKERVVELVDNDETAAQVACLLKARTLLILTNLDGIYKDISDPKSLITNISGRTSEEVIANIDRVRESCHGASRKGANGAGAKLDYIKPCIMQGTRVVIASSKYDIPDILANKVPCTVVGIEK